MFSTFAYLLIALTQDVAKGAVFLDRKLGNQSAAASSRRLR